MPVLSIARVRSWSAGTGDARVLLEHDSQAPSAHHASLQIFGENSNYLLGNDFSDIVVPCFPSFL